MACPHCSSALGVIEFDLEPPVRIEKCTTCLGMFFNPGEIEALLEAKTNPLAWFDTRQLEGISAARDEEAFYRPCPMCSERMGHLNFGGRSGVIIDRCGAHGIWLEGVQLRRLNEWWRAGGAEIHRRSEDEKAKRLRANSASTGGIVPPEEPRDWSWVDPVEAGTAVVEVIGGLLSWLAD